MLYFIGVDPPSLLNHPTALDLARHTSFSNLHEVILTPSALQQSARGDPQWEMPEESSHTVEAKVRVQRAQDLNWKGFWRASNSDHGDESR